MNTHGLKHYFINTLLTVALCAAYCLFGGLFSTVIGMLIAALLGVVFYREHFGLGICNTILILVIFTIFLKPVSALISAVPLVLLAVSLALGTRMKVKLHYMVLICTVLYLLDVLVGMKLIESISNGAETFNTMMLETGEQMRAIMQTYYPEEYHAMIDQTISMSIDVSIMLAPSVFVIMCMVLSYILVSIYKKLQMVQKVDMSFWVPFNQLQADKTFAILYLVLILGLTLAKSDMVFAAVCNVFLILTVLFFALGLSVFNYKLKQKGAGDVMRKLLTAALICFSTMFCMVPVFALVIGGVTDAFFDFRGLRPEVTDESQNR